MRSHPLSCREVFVPVTTTSNKFETTIYHPQTPGSDHLHDHRCEMEQKNEEVGLLPRQLPRDKAHASKVCCPVFSSNSQQGILG